MKKLLFIAFLIPVFGMSQVGINTTDPKATLDVNGNLRLKIEEAGKTEDFILMIDSEGFVKKIPFSAVSVGSCPSFLRSESSPNYLKFSSSSSIKNPNNAVMVSELNFVSAGTWIQNNTYFFTYSNTTGTALNIASFSVEFGPQKCNY